MLLKGRSFQTPGCYFLSGVIVSFYQFFDALRYHSLDTLSFFDALPYLGTADVEQWSFYYCYALRHFAHAASLTGIDNDGVVGKDIFVTRLHLLPQDCKEADNRCHL